MQTVRQEGTTIQTATAGDVLRQAHELTFTCLGMNGLLDRTATWSTNDRSLVFRLQYGSRSFLFPADIGRVSENRLIQQGNALRADVLLAPHHGSRTSTGEDLLTAVNPALIVVSTGQRRLGTLPDPEHLRRWREKKILPLITGQAGTITCRTGGKHLHVSTFTGERYVLDGSNGEFVRER